ncbi:MAG: ROK family protein [Gammaproteobacteria bacterium]|nr:ROK family protein [Gammaproteobacteria bacterium]
MNLFAGIEGGGTKFICALGNGHGEIYERISVPTTTPKETIAQIIKFLRSHKHEGELKAIGIGSFGPIDNDPESKNYGQITATPKPGWLHYNIVETFKHAFQVPVGFETDVATAALGEYEWGSAQGLKNFLYMTVGTGIGAAAMINGQLVRGMCSAEMGHLLIPHDKIVDPFQGICPYHGDCLEGMASGEAIKMRWQVRSALDLPASHTAWDLEANYLAAGLMNIILILSPQRIILGGGVMKQMHLFEKIRERVVQKLNGYVPTPEILDDIDHYIVAPGLADRSGVAGAIALARRTYEQEKK